nr:MAG TPA: structural protein [Caudoviricetes sp.]
MPSNIRYEFDKSARSPNNRVANESHVLSDKSVRVLRPNYGHFYAHTFSMIDKKTGNVVPARSYYLEDPSETVADLTGFAAYGYVVITDASVSKNVSISYQTVGGRFTNADVVSLNRKLEQLALDNRPVLWKNVLNKPTGYPAAPHVHSIYDTYNWQHVVYVIERLVQAQLTGDEASHDAIWRAINQLSAGSNGEVEKLRRELNAHIGATGNVHRLTPDGLGVYDKSTVDSKINALRSLLIQHTTATGNVHQLTPAQLGVYTIAKVDELIAALEGRVTELANKKATKEELSNKERELNAKIDSQVSSINQLITALRNNTYTKEQTDTKDTNILNYLNSQDLMMKAAVKRYLTGDEGALPAGDTYRQNGAQFTATADDVLGVMRSMGLGNGVKLGKNIIPISTAEFNELRWNKDGLYYGNVPDAATGVLYIDPDEGVDEVPTLANGRGSKNKPLATIGFALSQGPANVNRTIYLKEKKRHRIGRMPISIDIDGTVRYEEWPSNQRFTTCVFRGGHISFRPYGPDHDALYATWEGKSPDHQRAADYARLLPIAPTIEFRGFFPQSNKINGLFVMTQYVTYHDRGTALSFYECRIDRNIDGKTDGTGLYSRVTAGSGKTHDATSRQVFNWNAPITITFRACQIQTAPLVKSPTDETVTYPSYYFAPTSEAQNFVFKEGDMQTALRGPSPFIHFSAPGSSLILDWGNNISANQLRSLIGDNWNSGRVYFSGVRSGRDMYTNLATNVSPGPEDVLDRETEGYQYGEFEWKDGKGYGKFKDKSDGSIKRIQLFPPIWGE